MSDFSLLSFLLFRLIWLYDFEAANKACEHFIVLFATLLYVSIGHICILSCDRYIAIIYPLRYTEIVTTTRVKLALLVAWAAPVVSMVFLPLFYVDSDSTQFRTSIIGCSEPLKGDLLMHKVHLVFNTTLFVVIPFVVILALLVVWGASVVSTVFLPLFYGDEAHFQSRTSVIGCSEFTVEPHSLYKVHLAFNGTLLVLIPFVVTIFVYGHIAIISWSQSSRVEPGENLNPQTAELRRRK